MKHVYVGSPASLESKRRGQDAIAKSLGTGGALDTRRACPTPADLAKQAEKHPWPCFRQVGSRQAHHSPRGAHTGNDSTVLDGAWEPCAMNTVELKGFLEDYV